MADFRRLRTTTNTTTGEANTEIIGPSIQGKVSLVTKIHLTLTTAVATTLLIGRPAAKGVTPTSPVPLWSLRGPSGDGSVATWALAWGTSPTSPTVVFDRVTFPATVGTTRELIYTGGIALKDGGTLVIFNVGTTGVLDIAVEVTE